MIAFYDLIGDKQEGGLVRECYEVFIAPGRNEVGKDLILSSKYRCHYAVREIIRSKAQRWDEIGADQWTTLAARSAEAETPKPSFMTRPSGFVRKPAIAAETDICIHADLNPHQGCGKCSCFVGAKKSFSFNFFVQTSLMSVLQ